MNYILKFCLIAIIFLHKLDAKAQNKHKPNKLKHISEKIECFFCKGTGSGVGSPLICMNCIKWSNEYKRKVACHVCKDTRIVYKKECNICKGTGKLDKKEWTDLMNDGAEIMKKSKVYTPPISNKPMSDEEYEKFYNANTDASLQGTSASSQYPTRPKQDNVLYVEILDEKKEKNNTVADENNSESSVEKISSFDIVNKYLNAIGGSEEVRKVNSISSKIIIEINETILVGKDKAMYPNKHSTELTIQDDFFRKTVFDGIKGYQIQFDSKRDLSENEIKEFMDEKGVIPQLYYTNLDYSVEYVGNGKIDDEKTYKLKIKMPSGRLSIQQYSTMSGLLLKEETTSIEKNLVIIEYRNYTKVGNVLFPLEIRKKNNDEEFKIVYSDLLINEDVQLKDFD